MKDIKSADGEVTATEPKIETEMDRGEAAGPVHQTPKFEQPSSPLLMSQPLSADGEV